MIKIFTQPLLIVVGMPFIVLGFIGRIMYEAIEFGIELANDFFERYD